MSHIDDGALHAYLDGEASTVERERLEAHLAGCAACRTRLEDERALIERAGRLLGVVTPPERPAPPFEELRRPRRGGGYRLPLAWAATVVLAVAVGWYSRGVVRTPAAPDPNAAVADRPAAPPAAPQAQQTPPPVAAPASGRVAAPRDRAVPDAFASPQVADRARAADSAFPVVAGAVSRLEAESARPALRREGAAAPSPAAGNAIVLTAPRATVDQQVLHRLPTSWPIIEPTRARNLLGEEPAVIPGYPVQALRSNPEVASEILVEQLVDSGVVLLFERRSEAGADDIRLRAAPAAMAKTSERLARYVRSLRIEIAGPAAPDSLSRLLDLIR